MGPSPLLLIIEGGDPMFSRSSPLPFIPNRFHHSFLFQVRLLKSEVSEVDFATDGFILFPLSFLKQCFFFHGSFLLTTSCLPVYGGASGSPTFWLLRTQFFLLNVSLLWVDILSVPLVNSRRPLTVTLPKRPPVSPRVISLQ